MHVRQITCMQQSRLFLNWIEMGLGGMAARGEQNNGSSRACLLCFFKGLLECETKGEKGGIHSRRTTAPKCICDVAQHELLTTGP